MLNKFFVGIDGGLNGGITVLDSSQTIAICKIMPIIKNSKGREYDVSDLRTMFSLMSPDKTHVVLEKAHTMPLNGAKSNFTNGYCYGQMVTILKMLGISYEIVSAREWQKNILQGQTVKDVKNAVIDFCRNKFPQHDFTKSKQAKKIHDGMTDSCAIAVYCYRKNK